MIGGLVRILFFQGLGELFSRFALALIPGPVIGLIALLAWLWVRKGLPEEVDLVASTLVQHLGLLFVPAAVGVVMFWPQLRAHGAGIAVALVVSVIVTVAVTALALKWISGGEDDAP